MTAISNASTHWLKSVKSARSRHTHDTYSRAFRHFQEMLTDRGIKLGSDVSKLPEKSIGWFAEYLKEQSPATEQLYLTAVRMFFRFCNSEDYTSVNMERIEWIVKNRARRPGIRHPSFPEEGITKLIEHVKKMTISNDPMQRLRDLRDRALILTLRGTGLRIHEALELTRGQLDMSKRRAVIIGKGDKEAVVRFSKESINAITLYLRARAEIDGASGVPLNDLPIFAGHGKKHGKKIVPLTTKAGRDIFILRTFQALGDQAGITPHKLRHMFVTDVLRTSGGNLKLAQELARHSNIQVTQRYAHLNDQELDQGFDKVFS